MRMRKISRKLGQEFRAAMRLSPLAVAALLLVVVVWRSDSAANSGLFQSSPVEIPTITPTVPAVQPTLTAPVVETATTMPPGGGTPTVEATVPVPTETLTVVPSETVTTEPTWTPETEILTPTATSTMEMASPEPSATVEAEATPDDRARYAEGESNLKFEWGMLFDSVSLFLSYAWLCCGVLLFLAVPVVFIVLWVASRRRRQQEEE
jgi:hypothetical protein